MIGIVVAVVSAIANSLGMVMQHLSISRASKSGFDAKDIKAGVFKPMWFLGLLIMAAGVGIQMVALALTELVVVQTVMVSMMFWVIVFAVVIERARIGRKEIVGSLVLIVGVAAFIVVIQPGQQAATSSSAGWALATVVALVLVVILAAVARPLPGAPAAAVLGTASGLVNVLGAGLASAALQIMADSGWSAMFSTWLPYGAVALIIFTLVPTAMAFAAGPVSVAIAPMIAANPVIGFLLGVLLLGEAVDGTVLDYLLAVVALALMLCGIVTLSRSQVIAARFAQN